MLAGSHAHRRKTVKGKDREGSTHFVGIGGVGMSGLARILLEKGDAVSGSDIRQSEVVEWLGGQGAKVYLGHDEQNIQNARRVVYSTAIPYANPELAAAVERGLPMLHRSDLLAEVVASQRGIAVTGTHGKTTTAAMIAVILEAAGMRPTYVIGGFCPQLKGNGHFGTGRYAVYEACESDNSFLNLQPESVVLTNVERDHMDNHATLDNLAASFLAFLQRAGSEGIVVAGGDCRRCRDLVGGLEKEVVFFGAEEGNHYRAIPQSKPREGVGGKAGNGWGFVLCEGEKVLASVELQIPGRQNQLNACAAAAVCLRMGADLETVREALAGFSGVKRRFDYIGEVGDVLIFDDYAHHPTEIKATLAAAKEGWGRRTVAVFQPHLYSRTVYLLEEFASSFGDADLVIVTDVYPAREVAWPGVDGSLVVGAIKNGCNGKRVEYIPRLADIAPRLEQLLRPGDLVLTLGAGDIRDVAVELVMRSGKGGQSGPSSKKTGQFRPDPAVPLDAAPASGGPAVGRGRA